MELVVQYENLEYPNVVLRKAPEENWSNMDAWIANGTHVSGVPYDSQWVHVTLSDLQQGYIKKKHLKPQKQAKTATKTEKQAKTATKTEKGKAKPKETVHGNILSQVKAVKPTALSLNEAIELVHLETQNLVLSKIKQVNLLGSTGICVLAERRRTAFLIGNTIAWNEITYAINDLLVNTGFKLHHPPPIFYDTKHVPLMHKLEQLGGDMGHQLHISIGKYGNNVLKKQGDVIELNDCILPVLDHSGLPLVQIFPADDYTAPSGFQRIYWVVLEVALPQALFYNPQSLLSAGFCRSNAGYAWTYHISLGHLFVPY